jgi:LAGLIDADG DNA endonuclease family
MTSVILAHLIMGDGNFKSSDNIIHIYTNSFSKNDVERLGSAFTKKLGIIIKVTYDRNDQYMLTISKDQLKIVRFLTLPYMHNSMVYKLGLNIKEIKGLSFEYGKHLDDI